MNAVAFFGEVTSLQKNKINSGIDFFFFQGQNWMDENAWTSANLNGNVYRFDEGTGETVKN